MRSSLHTDRAMSGVRAGLTILLGASAVAAAAWVLQCLEWQWCVDEHTCKDAAGLSQCSFTNRVSLITSVLYLANVSTPILASDYSHSRGVCVPGERLALDTHGVARCEQLFSFPSALNDEIFALDANSHHKRHCGRWIDASPSVHTTQYWSFTGTKQRADEASRRRTHACGYTAQRHGALPTGV